MQNQDIISRTKDFVREKLKNGEGEHDWWHAWRVWKLSKKIAEYYSADSLVVETAALLHDIADAKFHDGNEELGPAIAAEFLSGLGVENEQIEKVLYIIRNISFKGGLNQLKEKSIELQIVQDADRLDALGAIGIARTFNYGGFKNRPLYEPGLAPQDYHSVASYRKSSAPSINHFYEKLLLLKDLMNTSIGKEMATKRHEYMEDFLKEFYSEWEGDC